MTRHSSSKFGSALAVPSFHLFSLLAILLTLDCASISLPTFLIIQLFIHSVTCKCLSDNFLRVVSHITHRFIEMGLVIPALYNSSRKALPRIPQTGAPLNSPEGGRGDGEQGRLMGEGGAISPCLAYMRWVYHESGVDADCYLNFEFFGMIMLTP